MHRALPQRGRRLVGAWCFLDRFGPVNVTPQRTMTVGPHPHIGLHAVTWLLAGQVLHSDSLGTQQPIRPAQLNLMTAGARHRPRRGLPRPGWGRPRRRAALGRPARGHPPWSPFVRPPFGAPRGRSRDGTGHGSRRHVRTGAARRPRSTPRWWEWTSPEAGVLQLPLDPTFEHGISVLHGGPRIADSMASPNQLVYVGTGHEGIELDLADGARVLLLGGRPFAEEILMWWNFVARERTEIAMAYADWRVQRSASAPSSPPWTASRLPDPSGCPDPLDRPVRRPSMSRSGRRDPPYAGLGIPAVGPPAASATVKGRSKGRRPRTGERTAQPLRTCGAAWSARRPVKAEVAGSNPVRSAARSDRSR